MAEPARPVRGEAGQAGLVHGSALMQDGAAERDAWLGSHTAPSSGIPKTIMDFLIMRPDESLGNVEWRGSRAPEVL